MVEIIGICPSCGSKQRQQLIRDKGKLGIFKCRKCGTLHHMPTKTREIMFITSVGGKATKIYDRVEEKIRVGRPIIVKKIKYEVRSIENQEGERVESCEPDNVRTVWIQPYEKELKVSVHEEGLTKSYGVVLDKDSKVRVGDIVLSKGGNKVRIIQIIAESGEKKSSQVSAILSVRGEMVI